MYSGIPGTTSLVQNEGILMFQEERNEIDAQDKVVDIFREMYEVL
mgnify:CR=1 FL=1